MLYRRLLLLIGLNLVAACTTYYTKPGATTADFERDKYECTYAGYALPAQPGPAAPTDPYGTMQPGYQMQVAGSTLQTAALRQHMILSCLEARGWRAE